MWFQQTSFKNMQFFVNNFFLSSFYSENKEKWQEETEVLIDEEMVPGFHLVVYNDEVNTFDYVIVTLMEVCRHSHEQAEQCTLQIHFKGKCSVKNGDYEELVNMRNEICRRGISAEIESI